MQKTTWLFIPIVICVKKKRQSHKKIFMQWHEPNRTFVKDNLNINIEHTEQMIDAASDQKLCRLIFRTVLIKFFTKKNNSWMRLTNNQSTKCDQCKAYLNWHETKDQSCIHGNLLLIHAVNDFGTIETFTAISTFNHAILFYFMVLCMHRCVNVCSCAGTFEFMKCSPQFGLLSQ